VKLLNFALLNSDPMPKINAAITGVHGFIPKDVLTNKDLETMVDTNDEWIKARTGIEERHILRDPNLATSDMGAAAVDALNAAANKPVDQEVRDAVDQLLAGK